jgi:hypothetical protein
VNPKPACWKDPDGKPCDKDETSGQQPGQQQGQKPGSGGSGGGDNAPSQEQSPPPPSHGSGGGNNGQQKPPQSGGGNNEHQKPPQSGGGNNEHQKPPPPSSGGSGSAPPPNNSGTSPKNCQSEGFFGSKSDCKSFYRCVAQEDGSYTAYDFQCPVRLERYDLLYSITAIDLKTDSLLLMLRCKCFDYSAGRNGL